MEALADFFLKNFFLICLALGVIFMVLRNYRAKRIVVLMPILVVSSALLLSVIYAIEKACQTNPDFLFAATLCCALGFIIRPLILYFFMRITITEKIVLRIAVGLIILNAIVYCLGLFIFAPDLTQAIFYYSIEGNTLKFNRGPLFYFAYFVVGVMMVYFVIYSIVSLKGRHRYDALASLICTGFIGIAVILETFLVADYLLNTTIAIACLFYVVHLYQQASIRDALTNLFDRKAYYSDLAKIESKVKGLMMIDMNSLKWINDNEGHEAGDVAIKTIAEVLEHSIDSRSMYVYRMGGDEFTIISLSTKDNAMENLAAKIKMELSKTNYSIALGYSTKNNDVPDVQTMSKKAEEMMYADKAAFYHESGRERRKI